MPMLQKVTNPLSIYQPMHLSTQPVKSTCPGPSCQFTNAMSIRSIPHHPRQTTKQSNQNRIGFVNLDWSWIGTNWQCIGKYHANPWWIQVIKPGSLKRTSTTCGQTNSVNRARCQSNSNPMSMHLAIPYLHREQDLYAGPTIGLDGGRFHCNPSRQSAQPFSIYQSNANLLN